MREDTSCYLEVVQYSRMLNSRLVETIVLAKTESADSYDLIQVRLI